MTDQQRFEKWEQLAKYVFCQFLGSAEPMTESWEEIRLRVANKREELKPHPSPGRGKRWDMPTLEEEGIFIEALAAFHSGSPTKDLSWEIAEAFKTGDRRTFDIISEAADYFKNTPRTQFSKTVIAARKSAITLKAELGQWPTKKDVRESVIAKMKSDTFGESESTRWTEVFKYAGLGFLPTGKPKRGPSRNR
jgi:hypothetical protein